jgi:hypothetical protein
MFRRIDEKAFQVFGRYGVHPVREPFRNRGEPWHTEGEDETFWVRIDTFIVMLLFLYTYDSPEVASFFEESVEGTMDAIELHLHSLKIDNSVSSLLNFANLISLKSVLGCTTCGRFWRKPLAFPTPPLPPGQSGVAVVPT